MTDTTTTNDLLAAFLSAHTDGSGLLDCIDNNGNRYTSQFLLDTIAAARDFVAAPLPPVSHVSVKSLEWIEHGDQDFVWHRSMPPIGFRYNIEDDGFSEKKHHLTVGQLVLGNFETLEEAKNVAQVDFDRRVLSCLALSATASEGGL